MEVRSSGNHRKPARCRDHPRVLCIFPVGILSNGACGNTRDSRLFSERVGGDIRPYTGKFSQDAQGLSEPGIDNAITRTMSRTIITHGSTQMVVVSMLLFGGEALHYFALALTIGILFGIYSSVLVASPILILLGVSRQDIVKPEKKEEVEALP